MWRRFLWWWRRRREEQDLDDELLAHLAIEASQRAGPGADQENSARASRRDFGNLTYIREQTRESWGWAPFERFFDDVLFGLRVLKKSPVWTTVVGTTLALGVGLTT